MVEAAESGDYVTALRLWRPLAAQGYAYAQYNLGGMYNEGQGVPRDYAEAVKWYRKAAKQGYSQAQYNVGVMYHKGRGVPQNNVQAHMWFSLAASRFPPGEDHDKAGQARDMLAAIMTPAQIVEARKLTREWHFCTHPWVRF